MRMISMAGLAATMKIILAFQHQNRGNFANNCIISAAMIMRLIIIKLLAADKTASEITLLWEFVNLQYCPEGTDAAIKNDAFLRAIAEHYWFWKVTDLKLKA